MVELEEYKFFAESTQKLTDRRQGLTQTYLTVNTGIFAVVAFLIKDAGLRGTAMVVTIIPLFLVGIAACIIWHRLIRRYQISIAWRHERLIEMETRIPGSYGMYTREAQHFIPGGKSQFSFSGHEFWLPRLFLLLYTTYAFGMLAWIKYS